MLGLRVTVPIACFRRGLAREYLETEVLPPPSTCYGFLLSLVGEERRDRHVGCRVTPVLLNEPAQSVVLRTVWRVKKRTLGHPENTRPDYQQLLSPIELVVWLDSSGEAQGKETLEARVGQALAQPEIVNRYGGLCLGESTHLIDEVQPLGRYLASKEHAERKSIRGRAFLLAERGRLTLPVWVDHVGSARTRHVTGNLVPNWPIERAPDVNDMPRIAP
jgi:CRISPR-associated protein Cas5t